MRKTPLFLSAFFVFASIGACGSGPLSTTTVAKVNGSQISLSSFEAVATRLAHMPGQDLSNAQRRREILQEMIRQELLYQAAMKDDFIEKSDRIKRDIAREYLGSKMTSAPYEPKPEEIDAYFVSKSKELEKVRASHILIKPKNPSDPASWNDAKKKIESVLAKIKAQGGEKADFAKFAKEFSEDDANKNQGGDLFYFERGKMVPEFSEAAFSLPKIGAISGVVKTQYGFHIIKLTGEQRGKEFFQQQIRWQLIQEKRKQEADKLLSGLEKNASVQIYDDILAKANVTSIPTKKP